MGFKSPDFYNLDDLLTENEKAHRDEIRKFVDQEVLPNINKSYRDEVFPKDLIPEFARLKTLGVTIEGYGCPGLNATTYGLMMQEIERGDSGLRSFASVQGALCMYPIWKFGTEEQKKKYLSKMTKGELIGCFGLTEPLHGSNPAGMITRAKKDGDDYILTGHKRWLTNGQMADIAIIWAKGDDDKLLGLIVERDLSGIEVNPIKNKHSLRASDSSEYIFNEVRVPASQVLEVKGFKGPFTCLNQARFGISWGSMGAAMACYDEALQYSVNRKQFDRPLASFQLVQAKLTHMVTEITKGQLLSFHLAKLFEKESFRPDQISMAKMNNVSKALEIARMARDILGANGVTDEFHTMRHMCNLETVNTYEGTEDIHRLIIGQSITGENAIA